MGEKIELRPEVQWFAELMEFVLRANDHKPGWKADSEEALLDRLHEEVAELRTEILSEDRVDHVVKEAVDVANFAMMIADVARGPSWLKDLSETAQKNGFVWKQKSKYGQREIDAEMSCEYIKITLGVDKNYPGFLVVRFYENDQFQESLSTESTLRVVEYITTVMCSISRLRAQHQARIEARNGL